jgi:cytochrome P450
LYSGAGAETTTGSIYWWMLAMVAFPETQRRAQAELDAVVGRNRVPSFADLPNLPYLRAMVKEVLRWRSVLPVGIPHCSIEDDWYEGMFIPKGSMCIVNVWVCNHDPAVYGADAARFDPSRHLTPDGRALAPGPQDTQDEGHVVYGFGKRICVGRHVANDTMFIAFAVMLWAMELRPAQDERGRDIPVDVDGYLDSGMLQLSVRNSVAHLRAKSPEKKLKLTPRPFFFLFLLFFFPFHTTVSPSPSRPQSRRGFPMLSPFLMKSASFAISCNKRGRP